MTTTSATPTYTEILVRRKSSDDAARARALIRAIHETGCSAVSSARVLELLNDCIECSSDLTEFLVRRKSSDAAAQARAVGEVVDPRLERSGPLRVEGFAERP